MSCQWQMLADLDQLLGPFFELLKNMYLTWIASVDKKVGDFRKLGVVDSAKFAYSRRFALVPCTVYLVYTGVGRKELTSNQPEKKVADPILILY